MERIVLHLIHAYQESPEFLQETADDFRINNSSPCVDAGHPDIQYNDTDGTRNDMGIFGGPGSP